MDTTVHQKAFDEMCSQASNPEPLHADLKNYLGKGKFWETLKHPLVFGVPYTSGMNYMYNRQLLQKREALLNAENEKDWGYYVFLHERPHRMEALVQIMDKLSGDEYWDVLGSVWSDSENIWQYGFMLGMMLNRDVPGRERMMDEREQEMFQQLPDELMVFRGHGLKNRHGYSWTLSYNVSRWFAERFMEKSPRVSRGVVKKSDVVALLLGRGEVEIVVDRHKVQQVHTVTKLKRPDYLARLYHELAGKFSLKSVRTAHGPRHWEKVERNGLELARRCEGVDKNVVRLFAVFHDSQRQNEDHDPGHGPRAAEMVKQYYRTGRLPITSDQCNKLEFACRHHNGHDPVEDPTIGACWDADRLDLIRVGILPDPRYLSLNVSKNLICRI